MTKPIVVLFENPDWLPPLEAALKAEGLSYELEEIWQGVVDPNRPPADAIYLNRMSPSSHTRGHLESVDLMIEKLAYLEMHGRRIVNGSRAFALEVSKLRQDMVLRKHGIKTPTTVLAVGRDAILEASQGFDGPFITKHNQGGKGLGIQLFNHADELAAYVDGDSFDAGPKGQVILQQYIRPREPFITRVELVDGEFLYAMRSDTSEGFELCPSDACQIPKQAPEVCPVDGSAKFTLAPMTADDPLVAQYIALCAAEGLEVAGIEVVEDADGERYTYDINGTTNYNSAVAEAAGVDGMRHIAKLARRLAEEA